MQISDRLLLQGDKIHVLLRTYQEWEVGIKQVTLIYSSSFFGRKDRSYSGVSGHARASLCMCMWERAHIGYVSSMQLLIVHLPKILKIAFCTESIEWSREDLTAGGWTSYFQHPTTGGLNSVARIFVWKSVLQLSNCLSILIKCPEIVLFSSVYLQGGRSPAFIQLEKAENCTKKISEERKKEHVRTSQWNF